MEKEVTGNQFRISVVIPTYKRFDYLKESLLSVFSQDFDSFEIIVADDGSPNFPKEEIENFINTNNLRKIKTTIIHPDINKGTVKNLNNAINHSQGELIVILAFDDSFYDNTVLSRISKTFYEKECDILFCRRMQCDEYLQPTGQLIPNEVELTKINKVLTNSETIYKRRIMVCDYNFGSGSAMYYKKTFFNSVGGYDTRYKLWEDGPFIAKIMRLGCNYYLNYDMVSIKYRGGGVSSISSPSKIMINDYVNYYNYEYNPYKNRFSFTQRAYIKQLRKRFENSLNNKKNGTLLKIKTRFFYYLSKINK